MNTIKKIILTLNKLYNVLTRIGLITEVVGNKIRVRKPDFSPFTKGEQESLTSVINDATACGEERCLDLNCTSCNYIDVGLELSENA